MTMNFTRERQISLTQFGGEGVIIIGPQSLRSKTRYANEISQRSVMTRIVDDHMEAYSAPINAGDLEILELLSYVRKAPFAIDLDAFLEYGDRLEEGEPGVSVRLMEEIKKAVLEVKDEPSPLDS